MIRTRCALSLSLEMKGVLQRKTVGLENNANVGRKRMLQVAVSTCVCVCVCLCLCLCACVNCIRERSLLWLLAVVHVVFETLEVPRCSNTWGHYVTTHLGHYVTTHLEVLSNTWGTM